jgi:hypothetical protein
MKLTDVHYGATHLYAAFPLLLGLCVAAARPVEGADVIVLRNLQEITGQTVVGFDEDGVRLSNSKVLGWDEIESATVSPERQAEFDRMLADLGSHLRRIRQRLSVGDYAGLLSPAEEIYGRYAQRDSSTAYMVTQALMWGRLAAGQREGALEPYLACLEYLRRRGGRPVTLPGERRLGVDPEVGITSELPPVWFDADAARAAMPDVYGAVRRMRRPRPQGAYLYFASLALAADDPARAEVALKAVTSKEPVIHELKEIVLAQKELLTGDAEGAIRRLQRQLPRLSEASKPLAYYWLGVAKTQSSDAETRQEGLLYLLRVPALYGAKQPELAGAALYHSLQTLSELNDARGSVSLRKELLERYGQTHYAARIRSPLGPRKKPEEKP